MENNFVENLKRLSQNYSQKEIATKTGFSQASINNYISKGSEPSISFLVAIKNAFGISVDDFLFSNIVEFTSTHSTDKYLGNYLVYYYSNSAYKGEIHNAIKGTLNYGVISIIKDLTKGSNTTYGAFLKDRKSATKLLKQLNSCSNYEESKKCYEEMESCYTGSINSNGENVFIELANAYLKDQCLLIFNNPPSKHSYIGGLGTINSISRGREHNPCIQYVLISKKQIPRPDGEIYNLLKLDFAEINFKTPIGELTELFKKLYIQQNDLSEYLTETQKQNIIENNLKYYFNEIIEANMFRFAKVSNRDDDEYYKILEVEEVEN